jgi:hypothetical protein
MADIQGPSSSSAVTRDNEETDKREVAGKAVVEKEIAKWKANEIARIERRRREKLAVNGRGVGDVPRAAGRQPEKYGARGPPTFNIRQQQQQQQVPTEQIQQLIFNTLNQQTGPLSGWQAGVLVQQRIGLIFNL